MFTPGPQTGATATRTRPKRGATLVLAGSLSVALAATMSPSAGAASRDSGSAGTVSASGQDAKRRCTPRILFRVDRLNPRNFFVPRTRFIDGPGGSITASVTRAHRVYSEIEIENEREFELTRDEAIRRLRGMFNPLLAEEHLITTGHEYTHEITKGLYGNLWYRVAGYRIGFSAWQEMGTCRRYRVTTGIANIPARVEGWVYWETRSPIIRRLHRYEKNGKNGKDDQPLSPLLPAQPGLHHEDED
jgi:hypothetical protein